MTEEVPSLEDAVKVMAEDTSPEATCTVPEHGRSKNLPPPPPIEEESDGETK